MRFPFRVARQLLVLFAVTSAPLHAQRTPTPPPVWAEYAVDDELERYLRSLQALGDVALAPWTVRSLSPVQLDRLRPRDGGHPWAVRLGPAVDSTRAAEWSLMRPRVEARFNSAFPMGQNDGSVWAGRGTTVSASVGARLRWGPLTVVANPLAFWAENRAFPLVSTEGSGQGPYADWLYPHAIDRPQRFGAGGYGRVDPGQSTVRLDLFGMAVGASTANLWWGPAQEHPFLLGTNAGGFPHAFVGTSTPVNLWIARLHGQLIWGRLDGSGHFEPPGPLGRDRRFASGLALVLTPRGLDNVELGAARFFHTPWPDGGVSRRYLTRPFEGLLKSSLPVVDSPIPDDDRSMDGENQLASVFARVVVPNTGFEAYAEVGREDHSWDLRQFILSPDERMAVTLGSRKSWRRSDGRMLVLRGERIDFRRRLIDRATFGPATYLHSSGSNQGHTHRGQLLGANVGVGSAAGWTLGVDVYGPGGRSTITWRRTAQDQRIPPDVFGRAEGNVLDVANIIGLERLLFRGRVDVGVGLELTHNLNWRFGQDRTNVGLRLSAAGLPW